jgi:hypothetical protein
LTAAQPLPIQSQRAFIYQVLHVAIAVHVLNAHQQAPYP